MRFSIATLGCKVNQYQSQRIREALEGCEVPPGTPGTDLCLINTCTVTHRSDAENRKLIRRALRSGARVVVTGCQAVVAPAAIQALDPGLVVVAPPVVGDALGLELSPYIRGFRGHARAFVMVQSGCDNFCTYCIVPHARGVPVSRPADEIVTEIEGLHAAGFAEVVLTGINMGLYAGGLAALVRHILDASAVRRIRLSSIEPWTVDDDLVRLVCDEPRICKHLHLPLQSGCDDILHAMGRPYDRCYYRDLVAAVRARCGEMCLGTDLMTGFPGEDQARFETTRAFIEGLDLNYLHVFPFSRRLGTPAADMPHQVEARDLKRRVALLRDISGRKRQAFATANCGTFQEALVTRIRQGRCEGLTSNYLALRLTQPLPAGTLVRVRLARATDGAIVGEIDG